MGMERNIAFSRFILRLFSWPAALPYDSSRLKYPSELINNMVAERARKAPMQ